MTVIAWDGNCIAADKQSTCGDLKCRASKLFRDLDTHGAILAVCGGLGEALAMVQWFKDGERREDFPAFQQGEDWARLIVWKPDAAPYFYERVPFPIAVVESYAAWGTGRDFALGALSAGASAKEAVLIAIEHCTSCGIGVDAMDHQGAQR